MNLTYTCRTHVNMNKCINVTLRNILAYTAFFFW